LIFNSLPVGPSASVRLNARAIFSPLISLRHPFVLFSICLYPFLRVSISVLASLGSMFFCGFAIFPFGLNLLVSAGQCCIRVEPQGAISPFRRFPFFLIRRGRLCQSRGQVVAWGHARRSHPPPPVIPCPGCGLILAGPESLRAVASLF